MHTINKKIRLRRTTTAPEADRKHLSENFFWQQTQNIFTPIIQKEKYDPKFYIDVELATGFKQSHEVQSFLSMPAGPFCLLLVGQHGVGKTSLINHCHALQKGIPNKDSLCIYFDGNKHLGAIQEDEAQLVPSILSAACSYLERYLSTHELTIEELLEDIYDQEPTLSPTRILQLSPSLAEKCAFAREHIARTRTVYLETVLRFFGRRAPGKVILILDNLDPLEPEIQASAVRQALALAVACDIKTIVAVRRRTESHLRFSDRTIFSQFVRTSVQAPPLIDAIERRVQHALDSSSVQNAKIGEGAIQFKVRECPEFAGIIARGLDAEGVRRIIEGVANDSVRQALRISLSIYASPYLDARRIVGKLSPAGQFVEDLWRDSIPNHIVVRSLLLRTSQLYDEDLAWVKNVFGTTVSNTHLGPFLRTLILRFLRIRVATEISQTSMEEMLTTALHADPNLIQNELRWLFKCDWIEVSDHGLVSLTSLGTFLVDEFIFHRDYLAIIACDVDMPPDLESQLLSVPVSFSEYLHNLRVLLEFLVRTELTMFRCLAEQSLEDYCTQFGGFSYSLEASKRITENLAFLRRDPRIASAQEMIRAIADSEPITQIREILDRFCGGSHK